MAQEARKLAQKIKQEEEASQWSGNPARALKYLEDFGQRQSQLFKVLEKYQLLPDNFENLQSQSGFLKQATSKNIEHLQQAISHKCATNLHSQYMHVH